MTTWTIKVAHPTQATTGDVGFNASLSDTGLRYDDSVALKAWCPLGSTVTIRTRRLLRRLEKADGFGFKYYAYESGGPTTLAAFDGGSEQVMES